MATNLSVVALVLALGAAALAGTLVTSERASPTPDDGRIAALEARLERFETALEDLRGRSLDAPTLEGLPPEARPSAAPSEPGASTTNADEAAPVALPQDPAGQEALAELIDEVVDKKAERILKMQENKKPSIDEFAETLELTESQRREVERDVADAQGKIKNVLEIPTDDGTVLLDELVEMMAENMASPKEAGPRWVKFLGKVMTEKVPGETETYAQRIDAVKNDLRAELERDLSEKQYRDFETWRMDPTEIEEVPGSPYEDIERRVFDRARELGAEIPDED